MHILDTDTLSHLQTGNAKIVERLAKLTDSEAGISIVTKAEILRGRIEFLLKAENAEYLLKAQKFLQRTEELLAQLLIISFNDEAAAKFDELRQNSKFRKIGRADLLIAGICLANNAVLITRNIKHFKQFPNLEVENWID